MDLGCAYNSKQMTLLNYLVSRNFFTAVILNFAKGRIISLNVSHFRSSSSLFLISHPWPLGIENIYISHINKYVIFSGSSTASLNFQIEPKQILSSFDCFYKQLISIAETSSRFSPSAKAGRKSLNIHS